MLSGIKSFTVSQRAAARFLKNQTRTFSAATKISQSRRATFTTRNTPTMRAFSLQTPRLATVPFKLADIGEGIMEVEILQWFVKEGDTIKQFDKVAEVQSDKATVEISSRFDGVVAKLHYAKGDMAKVGQALIDIEVAGAAPITKPTTSKPEKPAATAAQKQPTSSQSNEAVQANNEKVLATPAVRRIAREYNLDLSTIKGTGKAGRVMKEDVLQFIEGGQPAAAATTSAAATASAPSTTTVGAGIIPADRVEPVRGLRRTMIKSMAAALKIPHFGYNDEVNVDKLIELRAAMKKVAEHRGVKLSYMPFFIKAASMALSRYPVLNSSLSEDLQTITYKGAHNIGVAMDTPNGLIVPNIKNVQALSILEIAAELNRLQKLGKEGKLSGADLSNGTFTLSNIGTIGGTYASPVVLSPEVAIGALGKFQRLPRFDENDRVVPMNLMCVSWSADHRVIDGASIASFSNLWKQYLENPQLMLLDMK